MSRNNMSSFKKKVNTTYQKKDQLWFLIWLLGILFLGIWDLLFLNKPALRLIIKGFTNTIIISTLVIIFSLLTAWLITLLLVYVESKKNKFFYLLITFVLNLFRSIPQIIGLLFGFVAITIFIQMGLLKTEYLTMVSISIIITIFVFQELVALMRERIAYYKKTDFFNAMRVCGISVRRIINRDILFKNSRLHIFNKLISIFGASIFLLCSIDFILSVGLSKEVSAVNLPVTLGSLLAKIDSKQDILAIGISLSDPSYVGTLFFNHLQGISIAFLIVFTLLCIYKIANGFSQRYRL
jgi:ABC-type dipeptide/oligopeptide/nickel transport system permease subunit